MHAPFTCGPKRTVFQAIVALSVALTLVGMAATPAHSAPVAAIELTTDGTLEVSSSVAPAAALSPDTQADLDRLAASAAVIEQATSDGGFDYASAVANGAGDTIAREWAEGVILGGGNVLNAPEGTSPSTATPPQVSVFAACRGQNRIWTDYLGGHARFSSCAVPKVVSALQAGVGATALAATIATAASLGVAAVSAIVPALLQYSTWSIDACSKNGTGVELAFAGFVCWAQ